MGRKKKEVTDIEDSSNEKPIERDLKFVSSGSTNLNLALTNSLDDGYPVGKIVNLVGDKQLGKCTKNAYISNTYGIQLLDKQLETFSEGITENKQELIIDKDTKDISTHSYKEKVSKTYKITTRHGFELECTAEHPILIFNKIYSEEMIKTKDLKIRDVAIITPGTNNFGNNGKCDENLV